MSEATSGAAAYERLRQAIVRLELAPGTSVSEAQLVERFGFTKAAVRAALARLRADGLVLAEPRRGHAVAPLTMRDVLEIYDLRLTLEPVAAEAAAGAIGERELARLRALADPEFDVDDRKGLERFLAANKTIHMAIVTAAGNRRAARIVERLLEDSERARMLALRAGAAGRGHRARTELRAVLDAIGDGDGKRARTLMEEAIRGFRDELVERLQSAALDRPFAV
jgi:DNA-binding GntR family transcriptional regulator